MQKRGKRQLAMVLCLTMMLTLLPATALPAFAEKTITPDGAIADTWVQIEGSKVTGSVDPTKEDGKIVLSSAAANGNNLDSGNPAIFVDTDMNKVLSALEGSAEKTLSFTLTPSSSGSWMGFALMLNYNGTTGSAVKAYHIGYPSGETTGWFVQNYGATTVTYPGFTGPNMTAGEPVDFEIKWNDEGISSFKIGGQSMTLPTELTTVPAVTGDNSDGLKGVAFKVGAKTDTTTIRLSNVHYTGQATVSVYDVSGTVSDEADAGLADVEVTASATGGATYTATTNAQGEYTLQDMVAGTYTLTFTKTGYKQDGTQSVTVSNADVTGKDATMTASDAVEIQIDGASYDDWTQVGGTGVDGTTAPAHEDGRLVLTSGYTSGHKIQQTEVSTALFTSAKLNAELAAFQGDTKTLSFTLTPETKHSANNNNQDGTLPDYLAFGVVVDSNESNQGLFMGYSDTSDKWLFQSYGGSGSYSFGGTDPAVTPGEPMKFEITWTRSELTVKINDKLADTRSMADLPQTDKIAFCVGGKFYENEDKSLQDNRQTVIRISDLHYSGQETVSARYVKGTVTCGGTPVAGATVSVKGDLTDTYTQITDEAGMYSVALPLKEESYTLSATKDGYDTVEQTVAVKVDTDKSELEAVDFALIKLPVISGKVVDKNGKGILGATVVSDKRPEGASTTTNAEGMFEVIGAVDGEHTLTISAEGYETKKVKVTVNGADVSIPEDIALEDRQIPSYTLSTDDMDVTVAQGFPQAIQYTLKDGKTMYGQTAELDTIKINDVAVKPTVTSVQNSDKKVTYTMVVDSTNNGTTGVTATITAEIRVGLEDVNDKNSEAAGRTLGFYITDVTYPNNDRLTHPVDTIEIPNHSLVSVRSTEDGAAVTGAKLANNSVTRSDVTYAAKGNENSAGYAENFFAAFVYNDQVSAGLASNSAYGTGSAGSGTYPVRALFEAKDGGESVSIGLSSTLWYYDHNITVNEHPEDKTLTNEQLSLEQRIIAPLDMPFAKVVIAGDMNGSGTVDWQDGAIAYRETVMHIPTGGEDVADAVNLRISMNFGSMATNPFLIALDNVKRVAAHTDGLGQFVLLKGYAGEGHDSNHPQYDNIGIRMGGAEDLLTLMTEGEKLGATFGIHTNASEFYAEAITNESQIRRNTSGGLHYGWNWLDQGISINGVYDYATGLRKARWDKLYEIVKGHPFTVYVDVWGNNTSGREDDFQTRALSNEIISHDGWRIAHEWSYGNPYESTFQHWVTDFSYGGYGDKGKLNSNVLRFLLNQYKDSFPADFASYGGVCNAPLLGGPAMQGFEGWQKDGEYDLSIYNTFNQLLYTKFLQHYSVMEWTNAGATVKMPYNSGGAGSARNNSTVTDWLPETQIKLSDGTDNIVVTRGTTGELVTDFGLDTVDKFLAGEAEYRSRVVTLNGKVIVTGAPASAGEDNTFPADVATLKYLIPWYWDAQGERVAAADEKLYHWNAQGGQSTWELPNGWENLANVMVYELSDQGRGTGKRVNVANGSVTLSDIKANTCYVVTKGTDKGTGPKVTYGTGLHVEDPSFNIDTPKGPWKIEGKGSAVHTTNSEGIGVMKMVGEVSVSQQMTDLKAGTSYVSYVAVDNRSNAKAIMTITDNTGKVVATNYTTRSIARNYISSYYLHNGHGMEAGGSYFQNMFVYFTPEAGKTYTMTLSREAGVGNVYFDDLRTVEYGFNYSGFGAGQTAQKSKGSAKSPVTYVKDANGNNTSVISKLEQDFENVPQGIWPFVVGPVEGVNDNRTHVSELNTPFTQAGWDVKKLDDVIDGNWSIKTNGLSGRGSLVYQTIPQNFRFEPNNVYTVSFDYELGSTNSYVAVVGDGAYTGLGSLTVYNLDQTLKTTVPTTPNVSTGVNKADVGHMEFTVVGSESGQTWIGIYSKENANNQGTSGSAAAFGGYTDFVLDNLTIELAPPEKNELALLLQKADAMTDPSIYSSVDSAVTDDAAWSAMTTARTNGHTVFDAEDATTAQVTSAVTALKAAVENLVKVNVSISGTVTNANNKPVEGAVLTLENENYFPVGLTVTTGEDGTFEFVSKSGVELIPATYHIKAEATGYYVTTTGDIVLTKTDAEKTQNISLEAENPGAYVNDFNSGDISMMGPVVTTPADELPTMEWVEYNGSGALKVTWNGRTGETRATNNVVDKTVEFANGTFSFDVTALTTGNRFNVAMRTTDANNRLTIGQEDQANKWFGEFWGVSEGSDTVNNGYTGTTNNSGKPYVEPGATRNVRVTLDGTQATVYIDGMQVYSVNLIASNLTLSSVDAITTAGWCGINMRGNAGSEFIIDNIRIIRNDAAVGVYNISGAVTTGGSDPVSGAAVDLYDGDGNRVAGTTTNALGAYQISRVEPATYTVKVTAPFFQEEDATVTVTSDHVTGTNFDLDPDLTSLTALIAEVEALNSEDYTAETWTVLANALAAAKAINSSSSIAAVNTAYRDLSNAKEALEPSGISADFSELRALYNEKAVLQNAGYTAESWNALQDALSAASAVLGNGNATQAQIDGAKDAIQEAFDELAPLEVAGVDIAGLREAYEAAKDEVSDDYTEESWSDFEQARENVLVLLNSAADLTAENEEEIAAAIQALTDAQKALEKKSGGSSGSSTSSGNVGSSTVSKTETDKDGTVTTTVTNMATGEVTETTVDPDGGKVEKVTSPDKSVVITVTDPDGEELAKVEIPAAIPAPETKFEDIDQTPWAEKAINNIAGLKLVNGTDAEGSKYSPRTPMSRGELATVLHRLSQGKTDYKVAFKDVAEGKYYTEGIAWAAKAKVVTGYTADIFAPDDIITREQLAVMMVRYAKLIGMDTTAKTESLNAFVDSENTGTWAVDGVAWCVEKGILRGKGNDILDPAADVTRAEVAVMLDRFIALIK